MADPTPSVLIVDDFLDEEAWTEVWTHFQFADLSPVSRTQMVVCFIQFSSSRSG